MKKILVLGTTHIMCTLVSNKSFVFDNNGSDESVVNTNDPFAPESIPFINSRKDHFEGLQFYEKTPNKFIGKPLRNYK